ncbi:MAG: transglutaminase domain-containing protein [Bacilli bacterium]|nr:transglutaminase domain-containing protein [Bacilli bacterium]MBR2997481.1 transglutaminase domain-containing protein [Bacilli bacterium]
MGNEKNNRVLLFKDNFDKIRDMDHNLVKLYNSGMLDNNFFKKYGIKEVYFEESDYQRMIDLFTLDDNRDFYRFIPSMPEISIRNVGGVEGLIFNLDGVNVKVMKITDLICGVRNIFPEIGSPLRYGKCYGGANLLARSLKNDADLVTGYHYGFTDKSKYLHSWVETKFYDEDYVLDVTLNAVINKEGYYRIKNIKENEILQRINNRKVSEESLKYKEYFDAMGIKESQYNTFRDELISDLEKKR